MIFFKQRAIKKLQKKLKAMQHFREHNQPKDDVLKKEMQMYHKLAGIWKSLIGKKKFPFAQEMVAESLRASARLDDSEAQYQLGRMLMDEGRMREALQKEGLFASVGNERKMRECFEEAHALLEKSLDLGHIGARRLSGLCFINGWGVDMDREKGFERVVESIEQEKAWDKLPQIFASIGLNKPEFFEALTQRRGRHQG